MLWAGGFPDDLPPESSHKLLHSLPLTLVVGTRDEYVNQAQVEQQLAQLRALGGTPLLVRFEGKHELNAGVLRKLAASALFDAS